MEKLDLKEQWKDLYQPRTNTIATVKAPKLSFLMVDGEGDPNSAKAYKDAIEALYSVAYTMKFARKRMPGNVLDFGVMPLESLWWTESGDSFYQAKKSTWKWTAMILQPYFITKAAVAATVEELRKKKDLPGLDRLRLEAFTEGAAMQVLYIGPYCDEGPTIERLHEAIHAAGKEISGKHHEIYFSDPRRTAPAKLKTIIRQPMR